MGDMKSLVSGRWHFISGGPGEELYDIDSDPSEMDDLARRAGDLDRKNGLSILREIVDEIRPYAEFQ